MKTCPRCGKEHQKSGTYCSRSCANARINQSVETRSMRIKTMTRFQPPLIKRCCKQCQKEFSCRENSGKHFCSRSCVSKYAALKAQLADQGESRQKRIKKLSITRKRLFSEGSLNVTGGTTQWIKYKNIKVQGSYELSVCFILDEWKKQEKILDWEYTYDRISYVDVNGKIRSYLFDFKVFEDDRTYYIESKGRKTENDELKWKAAKDQKIDLRVWFLKDIQAVQANLVEASA